MSTIKPKAVLMFGPPGAGKGTIGAMLCAAGSHFHLSSGDIFRGLPPKVKVVNSSTHTQMKENLFLMT